MSTGGFGHVPRPPPTRGSVAVAIAAIGAGLAPPAHAGISRLLGLDFGRDAGAPRPRGDQSTANEVPQHRPRAPPCGCRKLGRGR